MTIDATPKELDLDNTFFFADIKCVQYFNGNFYVLANRFDEIIGQYLFYFDEDMSASVINPTDALKFILRQENKFNIGDGSIDIKMVNKEPDEDE
jgi:hypothetical protein